ncbi:MAG TPA: sigma factor [Terriglobales bacterium]|nr:sigma factor [Terriglobales bacterium]
MSSRSSIRAAACPPAAGSFVAGDDDLALVGEAEMGSVSAFEVLSSRYDRAILSLLLHLTECETEALDLCRAVFLAAYRNLPRRKTESVYVWLYQIAAEQWLQRTPDTVGTPGLKSDRQFPALSDRERLVFTLKSAERLALRTVAMILYDSEEAIARTFSRAVGKLQADSKRNY